MRGLLSAACAGAIAAILLACGDAPLAPSDSGGAGDGDAGDVGLDPDPVVTAEEQAALQALSPDTLPAAPPDVTNRFADDPAAAKLGQKFFYDTSFSGPLLDTDNDGSAPTLGKAGQTGRVACAGCHLPSGGFSDTRSFQRQISLGAGWGRRRAPSLLDVGQAKVVMWGGRHDTLYNQVFGPLESVVEMNSSRLFMAEQIYRKYQTDYESVFGPMPPLDNAGRFPALDATTTGCQPKNPSDPAPTCDGPFYGIPGDGAEFDGMAPADQDAVTRVVVNAGKAIGAFERLLTCGTTPFDAWMHGGAAVSRAAQRGAALFVGRAGCVSCHSGPFMSDEKFHNVGLAPQIVQQAFVDENDMGAAKDLAAARADPLSSLGVYSDGADSRLPSTIDASMTGAFRTPTLRCASMRPTFMHTGQLGSLDKVVAFFNNGGSPSGYLGTNKIHSLGLSELDQSDLVAFLLSLTGPGAAATYLQAP